MLPRSNTSRRVERLYGICCVNRRNRSKTRRAIAVGQSDENRGLLDLGLDLMRVCCCLLPLGAGGGINVDLLLSALVSEAGIDLFFPSAGVTYGAVLGGEMSELPRDRVGHASPFCCASLPAR